MVTYPSFMSPEWFKRISANYPFDKKKVEDRREKFNMLFSPEMLNKISDIDLEKKFFSSDEKESLAYALESNPDYDIFGHLDHGKAFPSYTWQLKYETNTFIERRTRDILVKGVYKFKGFNPNSEAEYIAKFDDIKTSTNANSVYIWGFLKYLRIYYPDLIPFYYTDEDVNSTLAFLGEKQELKRIDESGAGKVEMRFRKMWCLYAYARKCNISNDMLGRILYGLFGRNNNNKIVKKYYRINLGDAEIFDGWVRKDQVVIQNESKEEHDLFLNLHTMTYDEGPDDKNFYHSYLVALYDNKPLGIGIFVGQPTDENGVTHGYAARCNVLWLRVFNESDDTSKLSNIKVSNNNNIVFAEITDKYNIATIYSFIDPKQVKPVNSIPHEFEDLHFDIDINLSQSESIKQKEYPAINYVTGYNSKFPRNRIIFGAPGTGKSFLLDLDKDELTNKNDDQYERVTFHLDYTYANFVGCYKPVTADDGDIAYRFVPGPFMRLLVEALKNAKTESPKPYVLIIEEINRADAAAVFGDVFQLLDRDPKHNESSLYPIQTPDEVRNYLVKELGGDPKIYAKIRIPDNMFIWATMNTADQGVFQLDTAFKRRWEFSYIGINENEDGIVGKTVKLASGNVEWNVLRKAINDFLADNEINEDKQLGPYFLSSDIVAPEGDEIDAEKFIRAFKDKVLSYLYDDAAKQIRGGLFKDYNIRKRYSDICLEFDKNGITIFHDDIVKRVNEAMKTREGKNSDG